MKIGAKPHVNTDVHRLAGTAVEVIDPLSGFGRKLIRKAVSLGWKKMTNRAM
jgi:hypothetical protein